MRMDLFPCNTNHCYTGVGQIDIVMTPLGGMGWLIGEDFLDKKVVRRVEQSTQNRLLIDTVRVALNPIRSGANMLHGEHPWYRASRDDQAMSFLSEQKPAGPTEDSPKPQLPNHGNVFFGYTHTSASHCEVPASHYNSLRSTFQRKLEPQWLEHISGKNVLALFWSCRRFQRTVRRREPK